MRAEAWWQGDEDHWRAAVVGFSARLNEYPPSRRQVRQHPTILTISCWFAAHPLPFSSPMAPPIWAKAGHTPPGHEDARLVSG